LKADPDDTAVWRHVDPAKVYLTKPPVDVGFDVLLDVIFVVLTLVLLMVVRVVNLPPVKKLVL
jgi:hypothetical protein